jgi:5-methylcytosine-specific restriction endonuclease McrA
MQAQTTPKLCSIEGCDKPFYGNDRCRRHYDYRRNHGRDPGDPFVPRPDWKPFCACGTPLSQGNRVGECPRCHHARSERERRARNPTPPRAFCEDCGAAIYRATKGTCNSCGRKRAQERMKTPEGRAKERAYYAQRVQNPAFLERQRAASRASYERHKAKRIAGRMRWRHEHPQEAREQLRRYQAARRHAVTTERVDPFAVYERDRGICQICHRHVNRADFSLDHIVPISRGGMHVMTNLQTSHRLCNIKRNAFGPAQPHLF